MIRKLFSTMVFTLTGLTALSTAYGAAFKLVPVCTKPAVQADAEGYGVASFRYDKGNQGITMTWASFTAQGKKRDEGVTQLSACTVVDDANWRCGGEVVVLSGIATRRELHEMKDGVYSYSNDRAKDQLCSLRIELAN